ncbi:hypothetical protein PILCRDRAFT_469906 [Piloderma croceum F 1598]|uniref:Uncharacterized protein n=1 Tax=Piloderma croceum (strain F 1598) TaxID=765440 RepID=A0A0C3ADF5_PILCF|nr:hypothetical protein PILCRDRAFT_748764 [Piloderma croceum F 1598]KIM82148.1 hypothetical protein PILCRDRAFT_469906 [Piloderma croceum F 1598]
MYSTVTASQARAQLPRNYFQGWSPKLMIQIWHTMFLSRISGLGGNRCPALNGRVVASVISNGSSMRVVAMPQPQKMPTAEYQTKSSLVLDVNLKECRSTGKARK